MTKIHHAVIDGISGNEIQGALLDLTPEGREPPPPLSEPGDERPSELGMLARGVVGVCRDTRCGCWAPCRARCPNVGEVPRCPASPGCGSPGRSPRRR